MAIFEWLKDNLIMIVAVGWSLEELLRLADKLLPESITIDNKIADYLARVLKAFAPKKKPPTA